jgi:protoporphyrinogen oxidase
MGLAAAFHAVKAGHTVEVLEAAREPGGMAAHFDLGGLSIERFYHFVCKSDTPTMESMDELGIRQLMRWRTTSRHGQTARVPRCGGQFLVGTGDCVMPV